MRNEKHILFLRYEDMKKVKGGASTYYDLVFSNVMQQVKVLIALILCHMRNEKYIRLMRSGDIKRVKKVPNVH